jgi:hypothetical protein
VSGAGGRFVIPGVPDGTHPATAWHERLGEKAATVTVKDGSAELVFVYP